MKPDKIEINAESGKKLEIINEVNPYAWAQRERELLEVRIYDALMKIIVASVIIIMSIGGFLYASPLWFIFAITLLFGVGSFIFHLKKHAKSKKELATLKTKFKNNEIKEDIESSIMNYKYGDWRGKEERCFLLLDLPRRPVLDFEVLDEDNHFKLQIVMEKENGAVITRTICIELEHIGYNRRIEHIQIIVKEYGTEIRLPLEYYK